MKGLKKLEKLGKTLELPSQNNCFLIDWLTVVFHGDTVPGIILKLGLNDPSIPWEANNSFINGYPMCTSWSHIKILWGADDTAFYKSDVNKSAQEKVRLDMGICLDMSGQGCRSFEQFSSVTWMELLYEIFRSEGRVSITRLDLAYDDHIGLLDIHRIRQDVEDRYYVSKSRQSRIIWSDDQDEDIQGLTIEIGSRSSAVLIRIYDKAAERGFDRNRHWIRVEIQLRKERAHEAGKLLFQNDRVGVVAGGILRNYFTPREPTGDSNKCRWPIADYWDKLIMDMEKLSVWVAPGEPYNFRKSENHVVEQYGQFLQAYAAIHGSVTSLLDRSRAAYPVLNKKYLAVIAEEKILQDQCRQAANEIRKECGFVEDDSFYNQLDLAEILVDDPDLPW